MARDARIYNSQAQAQRALDTMNAAAGYPRRGANRGKGPFTTFEPGAPYVDGEPGWTRSIAAIEKHPTLNQWAIPDTAETQALEGRDLPVPGDAPATIRFEPGDVEQRDSSWDPPGPD
jgi:hypothetical protein